MAFDATSGKALWTSTLFPTGVDYFIATNGLMCVGNDASGFVAFVARNRGALLVSHVHVVPLLGETLAWRMAPVLQIRCERSRCGRVRLGQREASHVRFSWVRRTLRAASADPGRGPDLLLQ